MTDAEHLVLTGMATRGLCSYVDASSHCSGMSWLKEPSAMMDVLRKYDASTMRRARQQNLKIEFKKSLFHGLCRTVADTSTILPTSGIGSEKAKYGAGNEMRSHIRDRF
jgi:hypothetical protein